MKFVLHTLAHTVGMYHTNVFALSEKSPKHMDTKRYLLLLLLMWSYKIINPLLQYLQPWSSVMVLLNPFCKKWTYPTRKFQDQTQFKKSRYTTEATPAPTPGKKKKKEKEVQSKHGTQTIWSECQKVKSQHETSLHRKWNKAACCLTIFIVKNSTFIHWKALRGQSQTAKRMGPEELLNTSI